MSAMVSVLLPVRDGAATIGRAIASVQAQTFARWELLVVDDGSLDSTRERVATIAPHEPRIRLIRRPREGIVAALNAGLELARGEYIARMDADDESHPERLMEQVGFLRAPAHSDIGLVGSLVEFGGDRHSSGGYALHVDWINSLVTPDDIAVNRFVESPLAHPSVMFRREVMEKWGTYRGGEFPEDYELWLRWMDAGVRMAKVPRVLLRWNDSPARLSRVEARYDPAAFFRLKAKWVARAVAGLRETSAMNHGSVGPKANAVPHAAASERPRGFRHVLVWGAGRHTRKRAAHLETHGLRIEG
jgi:glycosyltransferase involved in cell wall biosynthesis